MSLRDKLLWAQAPLALALAGLCALAVAHGDLAGQAEALTLAGAAAALALGLGASLRLTTRLLRPLGVLGLAARRLGAGDLQARARVPATGAGDEIAELAHEFNAMADRLDELRRSQLGDLEDARDTARAALESCAEPLMVLDGQGRLALANAAAREILAPAGRPSAEPVTLPEPLAALARAAWAAGTSVEPQELEAAVRFGRHDGEPRWLPRALPLRGPDGRLLGVALSLRDVTRAQQMAGLRHDVLATAAHELKTPLTSLRMALHLLAEGVAGGLGEKQLELVGGAREDAERLQDLVDEVLEASRHQSPAPIEKVALDPREVIEEACASHRQAAEVKHVTLVAEVLPSSQPLFADRDRLPVALSNLVGNAVRHTPAGGRVVVAARVLEGAARLEVRDTGAGIAREHRERVFERFFRVPEGGSSGSGLGLWIIREIARAHGGEVGVESEPGRGSCFWIALPGPASSPAPASGHGRWVL